jgi:oligoendopeptidase F
MDSTSPDAVQPGLPATAIDVLDWMWNDYAPHFEELDNSSLTSGNVNDWLQRWSALSSLANEHATRLQINSSADTRDAFHRGRLEQFQVHLMPHLMAADQRLKLKLLTSGLEPTGMAIPLQKMRAEAERFREENLPLYAHQSELCNQYNFIAGGMTTEWEGRQVTMAELRSMLQEPERDRREAAWRRMGERLTESKADLAKVWSDLFETRAQLAQNAGCPSFREFVWPLKHRFDYTPSDCETYHQSVLSEVVPFLQQRHKRLRERLGVDKLRPWDVLADSLGRPPLHPFQDAAELEDKTAHILSQLDQELGEQFEDLRASQLDLANRPGKAPGGWCSDFPLQRQPYIFMNAVGLHHDVQTLIHEAGHAFHCYATYALPYYHQRDVFMEFNEVASMAMELLAGPYLTKEHGGFYSPAEAARARTDHLDSILNIWATVAVGDAFQHWIYLHPGEAADISRCSEVYREIWQRYLPAIDLSGIEGDLASRWLLTLHYFIVPFYYIEYGLAQMGAVQVWANAARDPQRALAQYKAALALGGTVSLATLYETAGAKFAFDRETMRICVATVAALMSELEPIAAGS